MTGLRPGEVRARNPTKPSPIFSLHRPQDSVWSLKGLDTVMYPDSTGRVFVKRKRLDASLIWGSLAERCLRNLGWHRRVWTFGIVALFVVAFLYLFFLLPPSGLGREKKLSGANDSHSHHMCEGFTYKPLLWKPGPIQCWIFSYFVFSTIRFLLQHGIFFGLLNAHMISCLSFPANNLDYCV